MEIIKRSDAPVFDAPGVSWTGYAAPSRGASQLSLCRVELAPGTTSLGLEGRAVATVDGDEHAIAAGDCLILPARTPFTFDVPEDAPFRALACIPAGGRATMLPDGTTIVPPWAE